MKCHNGLLCGAAAAAQKKKTNCFKSVTDMKALLKSLEEEFGRLTLYAIKTSGVYYSGIEHTYYEIVDTINGPWVIVPRNILSHFWSPYSLHRSCSVCSGLGNRLRF